MESSYNFRFRSFCVFLCFVLGFSVKVKFFVPLILCVCALPGKAVPEKIYTVSGGTLNPTHSFHLSSQPSSSSCCPITSGAGVDFYRSEDRAVLRATFLHALPSFCFIRRSCRGGPFLSESVRFTDSAESCCATTTNHGMPQLYTPGSHTTGLVADGQWTRFTATVGDNWVPTRRWIHMDQCRECL